MKTLEEYYQDIRASFPWVSPDYAEDVARREYRDAYHKTNIIGKLCELSSDPAWAYEIYRTDEKVRAQTTYYGETVVFKGALMGKKLITRKAAATVPNEPPTQKAGRGYENKGLHLME